MSTITSPLSRPSIVYPDDDGQPMAENTLQFKWIVVVKEGLEACSVTMPMCSSQATTSGTQSKGSPPFAPSPM